MEWRAIAAIVFIATAVNHLGLIAAIERIVRHRLIIVNCPKCATFWTVLIYGIAEANSSLFTIHYSLRLLAIALLCSYIALWLNLSMFVIDTIYNRIYGKIEEYNNEEDGGENDGETDS